MKIFILEDMEERISKFEEVLPKAYPGCELFIVTTAAEGKKILAREKNFDLILLDHDLGGETFVDSENENTGYQVAKFIAHNNITCPTLVTHSMNVWGARNILSVLPECVHIPFSVLINHFKI